VRVLIKIDYRWQRLGSGNKRGDLMREKERGERRREREIPLFV